MAYTITDRCVACGSCAEQCLSRLFPRVTASTRSTPISAFPAVPAPISAPPTLSRKANLSQTRIGLRKCLRRPIFCCIIA